MARTLSKPRRGRRKARRQSRSAPGAKDTHERELKRLRLSVCDDTGFRLHLATYDQLKRRDALIARVTREAEAEKVRVTELDLADTGPESNLVGLLRAHLQETDLPPGWRQAVMIIGIEQRLDYSSGDEGLAFLHHANLLRDAMPEAAPVPVVLWLSRLAAAAVPGAAPDLWHWRAANFDFTGDEAPRLELLREMTILRPEDEGGLSAEQRRARIGRLADLLAELEREGPPKSKRQADERANLLVELGIEHWRLGLAAQAIPLIEGALDLYRKIDDRPGAGYALGELGNAYYSLGEVRRAIEHHEQALVISREIGDRRGEVQDLYNLGIAYADLGELHRAIDNHEQAFAVAREIGHQRGEADALLGLGTAYLKLGDMHRAIDSHEQALVIDREIGDRRGEAVTLGNLGVSYADLGKPRRAIELYQQSLAIARKLGDRQNEGITLGNLGNLYYMPGELRRAIEHYEQALAIARETGDRRSEANIAFNWALALKWLGERDEALHMAHAALKIYEQIEDPNASRVRAELAEWIDD